MVFTEGEYGMVTAWRLDGNEAMHRLGWLTGHMCKGLQPPHLFSCTRELARSKRGSTISSLMVEGCHISHHRTGRFPFPFNQSGKFTGCCRWRFAHAVSFHRAHHASIKLDDR